MFNHDSDSLCEALGLTPWEAEGSLMEIRELYFKSRTAGDFVERVIKLPTVILALGVLTLVLQTLDTVEQFYEEVPKVKDPLEGVFLGFSRQILSFKKKSIAVEWLCGWNKEALAYTLFETAQVSYKVFRVKREALECRRVKI